VNTLWFACTDCKVYLDAGYRWAYWNLVHPGIVTLQAPVEIDRVLNASAFWTPPADKTSEWLHNKVFPSLRQFFSDHRGHHIVFWDSNDLPENSALEWLQVGYCPQPTARFFAEILKFKDWKSVLEYDKTVCDGMLEISFYSNEYMEAFRDAFHYWAQKHQASGSQ
jgi:hypothetical protein